MSATLRLLFGSEAGRRYDFGKSDILIGRDETCRVVLDDPAVSRRQARVFFRDDRYWLEAAGRNATRVNGQEVQNREPVTLADGDQIKICDWLLEFRCDRAAAEDDDPIDMSSISSSVDARPNADAIGHIAAADKLRVMLRISEALGQTLDTQALLTSTIDSLLEIFPQADHAFALLADGERLVAQVERDRHGGQRRFKYSATLAREAMRARRAILSNDLLREQPVPMTDSILSSGVRSIICVPLLSQKLEPLGVIELDAIDREARFDVEDLELLKCVARQVSLSLEYSQLHRRLLQQAQLERELGLARVIQRAFLPRVVPTLAGYGFWAYYQATGAVGGDYYDFVRLPDGRQVVLLADVAGKGIPAALMMARLSAVCRSALLGCAHDLCLALAAMNREICEVASVGSFVTLVLCAIEPSQHQITVASAGHMSPILRRHDGTLDEPADDVVRGFPLGLADDAEYRVTTRMLGPGECVALYSDGISDALDARQRAFSVARLRAGIARAVTTDPTAIGEALLAEVWKHAADQPQYDDMAMVVFGRFMS